MTRWIARIWTVATMALAGCSAMPPPVPMIGNPVDVARLEGEWSGEYHSGETRRSGSITFGLSVGADTAFGEVLMVPRQVAPSRLAGESRLGDFRAPQSLPIRFVITSGAGVTGMLDPYEDPDCGCLLVTRFQGRMRGTTIDGTYASTNIRTGEVTRGEWKVKRHARPPSAASGEERR